MSNENIANDELWKLYGVSLMLVLVDGMDHNRNAQNAKHVGLYMCSSRLDSTKAITHLRI